jgi:hypothetical protein
VDRRVAVSTLATAKPGTSMRPEWSAATAPAAALSGGAALAEAARH